MGKHSKKEQENKKKRAGMAIAIIITFIMLSSTLAYVLMDTTDISTRYRGVKFSQDAQGFFSAKIYGRNRMFYTSPEEFSYFNISDAFAGKIISAGGVYIAFNPGGELSFLSAVDQSSAEIFTELAQESIFVQRGITNESQVYALPIIDCKNATAASPVLIFQMSNESSISEQENCLTAKIQANRDVFAIKDSLQFSILYNLASKK
jgi:hypothetical protein